MFNEIRLEVHFIGVCVFVCVSEFYCMDGDSTNGDAITVGGQKPVFGNSIDRD